ncbi:hypothetical protein AgCh_018547 [Apium graveolens]
MGCFLNMSLVSLEIVSSYGELHFNVIGTAYQVTGVFLEAMKLVLIQTLLLNNLDKLVLGSFGVRDLIFVLTLEGKVGELVTLLMVTSLHGTNLSTMHLSTSSMPPELNNGVPMMLSVFVAYIIPSFITKEIQLFGKANNLREFSKHNTDLSKMKTIMNLLMYADRGELLARAFVFHRTRLGLTVCTKFTEANTLMKRTRTSMSEQVVSRKLLSVVHAIKKVRVLTLVYVITIWLSIEDEENESFVFDDDFKEDVNRFELCLSFRKEDMQWVLNGGPWSFDNAMVALETVAMEEDPAMGFNTTSNVLYGLNEDKSDGLQLEERKGWRSELEVVQTGHVRKQKGGGLQTEQNKQGSVISVWDLATLTMILLGWNCRGLGQSRTVHVLKEMSKSHKPVFHAVASDHEPIKLELINTMVSKKQFQFKFENTWLKEESFHADVAKFWKNLPAVHLLPKLISVSNYIAKWGRTFFHKFRDKVIKQKEIIDQLKDREDDDGIQMYFDEKEKLSELLLRKELYWKQRAKTFWLEEGDSNSKFFHASASSRKKSNLNTALKADDGTMVTNHEQLCIMLKNYYSNIFSTTDTNRMDIPEYNNELVITSDQNEMLTAELDFEEFTEAVKYMHPDEASGPDGLNPTFFQHFWKLIGKEVFQSCKEWLLECKFPATVNDTTLVLILKKEKC